MTTLYQILIIIVLNITPTDIYQVDNEIVTEKINHNGIEREYLYFTPNNLPVNAPLIIVMHGFTSNAKQIMAYSKMNEQAIKYGFAVAYPQGTKDKKGRSFWNVGYEFHADSKVDDIDFIAELVGHLQGKYTLSVKNTFATGMSNGGEMCFLLACRRPSLFRAVAPVAGTMMTKSINTCKPASPPPIYAIAGTADQTTNFNGDPENKDGWGAYLGIPEIINYWAKRSKYNHVKTFTLTDLDKKDSSTVFRKFYMSEKAKSVVVFDKIIGGGHDWPSAWGNKDINATEEICKFFNQFIE
jgi:polyhydroxybutyrate depolymerase